MGKNKEKSSDIESGNVYTSPPFKFIVEGKAFYIHAALVSHHSRPLDRMMNGDMSEAQKGYATLEEVDEGIFSRFAEWVNKGYYTSAEVINRSLDESTSEKAIVENPQSEKRVESPAWNPQPDEVLAIEDDHAPVGLGWAMEEPPSFGVATSSHSSKLKRHKKSAHPSAKDSSRIQLKESFIHRKALVRKESISVPPPLPNQSPEGNYTDVFLSHAQLYVFAEKYDIRTLKILALENLQASLAIFTLYEERTGDIIALLRYVYANTSEPIDGVEDLRTLLTHYMGYEMDTLMKDGEFRNLMLADGGALLGDFMRIVMKRISMNQE
ncbi:MAG: hypothetical protein L6R38_005204 [Xanthoria sp. 2 TBL-2021]|nr:MAG: hypothetical protein L6R38_005204 [Xanthoria sp. 2 TBL-2021]